MPANPPVRTTQRKDPMADSTARIPGEQNLTIQVAVTSRARCSSALPDTATVPDTSHEYRRKRAPFRLEAPRVNGIKPNLAVSRRAAE